jgi:hypothetical protein
MLITGQIEVSIVVTDESWTVGYAIGKAIDVSIREQII